MDVSDYIDTYFTTAPSLEQKKEFEKKITDDPLFAEEVSFYLLTKEVAKEQVDVETRKRFRDLYTQYKQTSLVAGQKSLVRKLWPFLAAAVVVAGIIFGLSVFLKTDSPVQLADGYIRKHLQTLGVTMGSGEDSLQRGLRLYNDGKLGEALNQFAGIVRNDTSVMVAKKYAGIVSLRLEQYDKAISYFSQLENNTQLYANPGAFYHALTLLKRNKPGDRAVAKALLERVVKENLEGEETAREWLKDL